jgi:hypothetical protein
MKTLTYPEALDEVARTLEYQNFEDYKQSESDYEYLEYAQEQAAILYARAKWDEACEAQRNLLIKQMPVAHLVRREISTMQFVKHLKAQPKPEFKP